MHPSDVVKHTELNFCPKENDSIAATTMNSLVHKKIKETPHISIHKESRIQNGCGSERHPLLIDEKEIEGQTPFYTVTAIAIIS